MRKTAVITARIEPELKASAGQICAQLGLTLTQAITLFLRQLELQQGLPFDLKVPPAAAHTPSPKAPDRQRLAASDIPEVDRGTFSIHSDFDSPEEKCYWLARLPAERLQHMERLRRINYGAGATTQPQRILTVIEG